jgi:hypothetical protein
MLLEIKRSGVTCNACALYNEAWGTQAREGADGWLNGD